MNSSILSKEPVVLITGANGYIGSYLTEYLQKKDVKVIPFTDNLITTEMLPNSNIIVHCAGQKPREDVTIEEFIDNNIMASVNLSRIANKKCKIIYLSTMAVYTLKPYGLTKLMAEWVFKANNNVEILRLPRIVDGKVEDKDIDILMGLENLGEQIYEIIRKSV